jgi:hypothetical protein
MKKKMFCYFIFIYITHIQYDKQDQQGKAAFNERNPHKRVCDNCVILVDKRANWWFMVNVTVEKDSMTTSNTFCMFGRSLE